MILRSQLGVKCNLKYVEYATGNQKIINMIRYNPCNRWRRQTSFVKRQIFFQW